MSNSQAENRQASPVPSTQLLADSLCDGWVNMWIRLETGMDGAGDYIFTSFESARKAACEWCRKYPDHAHTYLGTIPAREL